MDRIPLHDYSETSSGANLLDLTENKDARLTQKNDSTDGFLNKSRLLAGSAAESFLPAVQDQIFGFSKLEIGTTSGSTIELPKALETLAVSGVIGFASKTLLPSAGLLGKLGHGALATFLTFPGVQETSTILRSIQNAETADDFRLSGKLLGEALGNVSASTALGVPSFKVGTIGSDHFNSFRADPLNPIRLHKLRQELGPELIEHHPKFGELNLLDKVDLNRFPDLKQEFALNLGALKHAASYEPVRMHLDDYQLAVHNTELASLIKPKYSQTEFQKLLDAHEKNGFWNLKTDKSTGFIQTSGATENAPMVRQWVTDSVRVGELQKDRDPESWKKSIATLAKFYSQEVEILAMKNTIADPNYFRQGPLENGVAHVFLPDTLRRDTEWFNNKRLESHGLALKNFSETILAGMKDEPKAWGLSAHELNSVDGQNLLKATNNLADYILAVNTEPKTGKFDFKAPSAGNWEEMPFPGLTSDAEAMRAGLEAYRTLLSKLESLQQSNPAYNELKALDRRTRLDEAIEQAQKLINERINGGAGPMEHPNRPLDSSLAFITTSSIRFGDAITTATSNYKILDALEKNLVKENGIIRYEPFEAFPNVKIPDGYLGINSWLMPSLKAKLSRSDKEVKFTSGHSEDTSTPEAMAARASQTSPEHVAQWPWVSTMADGYARQVLNLMSELQTGKIANSTEVQNLIDHGSAKATEYLNRSLARTTGLATVKPNGRLSKSWVEPEAFEFMRTLDGKEVAIPGVNTPLAWAHASRYSAFKSYGDMLKALAK